MCAVLSPAIGDRGVSGLVDKCRDPMPAKGMRTLPIDEATGRSLLGRQFARCAAGEARASV